MSYNFKKLVKPNVETNGDTDLDSVIESLALFYNPALMSEYAERLLKNTTLLSVFSACLKTKNMKFFKAYSSLLHNRVKAYEDVDKYNPELNNDGDVFEDKGKHFNYITYYRLYNQYKEFLNAIITEAGESGKAITNRINEIKRMICNDVSAGVMYDNINMYLTLIDHNADDTLCEIEDFMVGSMETNSDDGDVYGIDRYTKIYYELEGNLNIMQSMTPMLECGDTHGEEDIARLILRCGDKQVSYSYVLMMDMKYHLSKGVAPLQDMVNVLDECNVYLDDDGCPVTKLPSDISTSLRDCICAARKWLVEALVKKLKWKSMASNIGSFNRVPLVEFELGGNDLSYRTSNMCDLMRIQLSTLSATIPPLHGIFDENIKNDMMKVIVDALDTTIRHDIKSKHHTLNVCNGYAVPVFNETEDTYIRLWSTEMYRALGETDKYYNIKNYKNTKEN